MLRPTAVAMYSGNEWCKRLVVRSLLSRCLPVQHLHCSFIRSDLEVRSPSPLPRRQERCLESLRRLS